MCKHPSRARSDEYQSPLLNLLRAIREGLKQTPQTPQTPQKLRRRDGAHAIDAHACCAYPPTNAGQACARHCGPARRGAFSAACRWILPRTRGWAGHPAADTRAASVRPRSGSGLLIIPATSLAVNWSGHIFTRTSSTSASDANSSSSSSCVMNNFWKSSSCPASLAAFSTAEPTSRHHILNLVLPSASRAALSWGLPSRMV